MGLVIMAYAANSLKEYYLPAINDSNYTLVLENKLFATVEDVYLDMEVLDNRWYIVSSDEYTINDYERNEYVGEALEDGQLFVLKTVRSERISLIIAETQNIFHIMHKYSLQELGQIRIGSDEKSDIQYNFMTHISKQHAVLVKSGLDWYISDTSSNGTFINGYRIGTNYRLQFGDCVCIYGLKIVYLGNIIAVSEPLFVKGALHCDLKEYEQIKQPHSRKKEITHKKFFKRSPRQMQELYTERVDIEAPPVMRKTQQKPLFLTIGPSFTMAIPMILGSMLTILGSKSGTGAYMFTGIITSLGSAAFGVFWALNNIKYTRSMEKEEEEERYNSYGQYLIDIANFLKEKYQYNAKVLNETYISASQCCTYDENNANLWNRNLSHKDFLAIRLGVGSCPFQVEIGVPQQKFAIFTDELARKPEELKKSYD